MDKDKLIEILLYLCSNYSDKMNHWADRKDEPGYNHIANAYALVAFDLSQLLALYQGDFDNVLEMQKKLPGFGTLQIVEGEEPLAAHQDESKADWPLITTPGDDPDDPDPQSWN